MTITTGGVAAPTGLFEDLLVKEFSFRRRKSFPHAVFLPRRCVVQGSRVGLRDILVAGSTGFHIIGGPLDHAFVGNLPVLRFFIPLVTGDTALRKMRVRGEDPLVHQQSLVHLFRLHGRRRTCSPLPFFAADRRRNEQGFHQRLVRMASDAAAARFGNCKGSSTRKEDKRN